MKLNSTELLDVIHNVEPELMDEEGERGFSRDQLEDIIVGLTEKKAVAETQKPLEWYVYVFDVNSRHIYHMNIFNHGGFNRAVKAIIRDQTEVYDKETFASAVRGELMYYFWSKVEYEVMISDVMFTENQAKIDVYDQILMNWDRFIDYLWQYR